MTTWTNDRRRVEAGAAWLDHVMPEWIDEINILDLNLASATECVLGQIVRGKCDGVRYASFDDAILYQDLSPETEEVRAKRAEDDGFTAVMLPLATAQALGFHTYAEKFDATQAEYGRLTEFWVKLIEQRRAA